MPTRFVAAAIGLAALLFSAGASAQTITIGSQATDKPVLDPVFAVNEATVAILGSVFEPLVLRESGLDVKPGQAESWSLSDDGTVYTFRLREGLVWSDGAPVTAHDFALSIRRLMEPAAEGERKSSHILQSIRGYAAFREGEIGFEDVGVRTPDDRTLEIALTAPTPHFLSMMTFPAMSPTPSHLTANGVDEWLAAERLVSNGPYTLERWEDDVEAQQDDIVLVKNPRYAGPDEADAQELRFRAYRNRTDMLRAVVSGELDIVGDGLQGDEIEWLRQRADQTVFRIEAQPIIMSSIYASFNTRKAKLADPRVRRAILMAVDRAFLARRVGVGEWAPPAVTFAPPSLVTLRPEDRPDWLDWDMDRRRAAAREILSDLRGADAEPLGIRLAILSRGLAEPTALALRAMLADIGVDVQIDVMEIKPFVKLVVDRDYEMFLGEWTATYPDPDVFHGLMATGADRNYGGWSHAEFDALHRAGASSLDPSERARIASRLEALMLQEVPVFSLIHPVQFLASSSRIESFSPWHSLGMALRGMQIAD